MSGYTFASGSITGAGAKLQASGQVVWTPSRTALGCYSITFAAAHPLGTTYIANVSASGAYAVVRNGTYAPTSTVLQISTYTVGTATAIDPLIVYFMVLAS